AQKDLLGHARDLLRKKAKTKRIAVWPGPIAKFLLAKISAEELRGGVADVPILHERQLCQAEFYIGVRALEDENTAAAERAFQAPAKLHVAKLENEYYLAAHELGRL